MSTCLYQKIYDCSISSTVYMMKTIFADYFFRKQATSGVCVVFIYIYIYASQYYTWYYIYTVPSGYPSHSK